MSRERCRVSHVCPLHCLTCLQLDKSDDAQASEEGSELMPTRLAWWPFSTRHKSVSRLEKGSNSPEEAAASQRPGNAASKQASAKLEAFEHHQQALQLNRRFSLTSTRSFKKHQEAAEPFSGSNGFALAEMRTKKQLRTSHARLTPKVANVIKQ